MKNTKSYLNKASLAALLLLIAVPAFAGYDHDIMNPEYTAATAPSSLPATCRLLAADVTNQKPIYINCDEVAGLNGSVAVTNGGTITTIDINGGTIDGAVIGGASAAAGTFTTLDATDLEILTGDVTVGAGTPTLTQNGDDAYVTGTLEADGNANLGGTLTVSGASTLSGDVIGDGGDQLYGYAQDQVASTTTSITAAQCGKTFVSDSADVMNLPEASTVLGCRFTFVCGTADDFDINPADGTDVIGITGSITGTNTTTVLAPSAGDAVRCTDIGSSATLEAVAADLYAFVGTPNGIWTDVN